MIDILLVSYAIFVSFVIFNSAVFGLILPTTIYHYLKQLAVPKPSLLSALIWPFGTIFIMLVLSGNLQNFIIAVAQLMFQLFILYIIFKVLLIVYDFMYPKKNI
tara:strand:+ start:29255 stop:29566 length:312 start_codon:yes stop_codon:yes gene_type:complete